MMAKKLWSITKLVMPPILVLGIALAVWHFAGQYALSTYDGPEKSAEFGDSYGYANSLLSSLAFAGAMYAIVLQTVELRYQRREIDESQKTWEEQRDAMRRQADGFLMMAYLQSLDDNDQRRVEFVRSSILKQLSQNTGPRHKELMAMLKLIKTWASNRRDEYGEADSSEFKNMVRMDQYSVVTYDSLLSAHAANHFVLMDGHKNIFALQDSFASIKKWSTVFDDVEAEHPTRKKVMQKLLFIEYLCDELQSRVSVHYKRPEEQPSRSPS